MLENIACLKKHLWSKFLDLQEPLVGKNILENKSSLKNEDIKKSFSQKFLIFSNETCF
jgi:hypothetical protein